MSELGLTGPLVGTLLAAGPAALALALFVGPLGVPIPTGLLVLGTGALARQGLLDGGIAVALGLAATVLGDVGSFVLGRLAGPWLDSRAGLLERARQRFRRNGPGALLATRLLLTSLDAPTNLIAGASRYPFRRFLTWDLAGRIAWLLLYGGAGYLLGSQWQMASEALQAYGPWLGAAAAAAAALAWVKRRLHQRRPETKARDHEGPQGEKEPGLHHSLRYDRHMATAPNYLTETKFAGAIPGGIRRGLGQTRLPF